MLPDVPTTETLDPRVPHLSRRPRGRTSRRFYITASEDARGSCTNRGFLFHGLDEAGDADVTWIRTAVERWPAFRAKLPEVVATLRNQNLPLRTRLGRAWQLVNRHLLGGADWLSSRTESLLDIRFRRSKVERLSITERLHRRLQGVHTIGQCTCLGAAVLAFSLLFSVLWGMTEPNGAIPDRVTSLADTLVSVGELLSGAAGILFAVIVFGIQFHGEKLDKAAFLVRYLRRREGLIPIAAVTLAVVAANVIVSIICALGLPYAAVPMAVLDVPLVLLVLWLVLWLLYRMAVSVSEDFVTLLRPSLTLEYDLATDEDVHHARQVKAYEEAVDAAGLRYSAVGGYTNLGIGDPIKLSLSGNGCIADVNLSALNSLGNFLRTACPNHEPTLCLGPRDSVANDVALVLSPMRDEHGRRQRDAEPPSDKVASDLRRKLQLIFRLGSAHSSDVPGILARFEDLLVGYARDGLPERLADGLKIQEKLIDRGLSRLDAEPSQFSLHRERLPDFLAGFGYFDMAKGAVARGKQETILALFLFAGRMMGSAVQHRHPGLLYRASEIILGLYYQAMINEALAEYVGESIDNVLLTSHGSRFEYSHSSWRRDPPKIAEQMPVLIVDLGWRLRLVKAAIEAGRTTDALNFQDRLFHWDEHSGIRYANPDDEQDVPSELREACDLMSYSTLILAAWCLHLVESNHERADSAKAVFQRCARDLGGREHLMRLWEAVRSKSFPGQPLDDPFGTTQWTMVSPGRTGVCVAGYLSDAWIERGLIALLLTRPSATKYETPTAFQYPPPFRPKTPDEVRALANAILSNDLVRDGLLTIPDEKRDECVDRVVTLYSARLRLFKLQRLTRVVSEPLSDQSITTLHVRIAEGLAAHSGFVETLERLGGIAGRAVAWFTPRATYAIWLFKEEVIASEEGKGEIGSIIAENVRDREGIEITHAAERLSQSVGTVQTLTELPDAVRSAIARLRKTTRNPILVLVPREDHIIRALIGKPAWQLVDHRTLGAHHLGEWEGCKLFRFPYVDPRSVVILDTLAFYGRVDEDSNARLNLCIEHPNKEAHNESLKSAESETDPAKIPETNDVQVLATVRLALSVGLNDGDAAIRVDLDLTKLGYALMESDPVYHRPDCSLLTAAQAGAIYTLARQRPPENQERTPCEQCHPEKLREQG